MLVCITFLELALSHASSILILGRVMRNIATNYSFTDAEHSDAVSDRRIIVPFLYTMPRSKRNMNLQEDLWNERDEIVTSLIPYARRLWSNDFNFSYCQKADQLAAKWDGAERSIEYFLRTYYRTPIAVKTEYLLQRSGLNIRLSANT